jgi:hypothetical protein
MVVETTRRAASLLAAQWRYGQEVDFGERSAVILVAGGKVIPMSARITVDATGQICSWSPEAEELLG